MNESATNFLLSEAKNVGDALASARLFNEEQNKILPLVADRRPVEQV